MTNLVMLAVEDEFVPPDHVAANIAVPLGLLIFAGSVYLLLWSVYGAKKGALVLGTAFFGFSAVLGVFWWFGAPGTPIATGPQSFPGQPADNYQGKWFPMEPGSERAGFFPATRQGFEAFQTPREYMGIEADLPQERLEGDERFSFIQGDLRLASDRMISHFLPRDEQGTARLGQSRRTAALEVAGDPEAGERRATPFFTARIAVEDGVEQLRVVDDAGHRVAAAKLELVANFVQRQGPPQRREVVVEERTWYAFKDPGAVWFPSAVWTGVSLLLFAGSLFGLDRLEQREKRRAAEAEQPTDAPATVAQ